MRVVLDVNILVSALLIQSGRPAAILDAWVDGRFTLLTCAGHLDELRATLQKPRIAARIKPYYRRPPRQPTARSRPKHRGTAQRQTFRRPR